MTGEDWLELWRERGRNRGWSGGWTSGSRSVHLGWNATSAGLDTGTLNRRELWGDDGLSGQQADAMATGCR